MLANIDIPHLKNTNWYRQGGAGAPLFFYIPFQSGMAIWGKKNTIIEQIGTMHHGFFNSKIESQAARTDIEKQKRDKEYISRLIDSWKSKNDDLFDYLQTVEFDNLKKLSNTELLRHYSKLCALDFAQWGIAIHIENFDSCSDEIIKNCLKQYEATEISKEDLNELITPDELLYTQIAELELLKICLDDNRHRLIADYKQKYFWLENNWAGATVLDENHFRGKMEDLAKPDKEWIKNRINELENLPLTRARVKDAIRHKYNLSVELENVLYFFDRMTFWRDIRKKAAQIFVHYHYLFATEFGRRLMVPTDHIIFATPQEIIAKNLEIDNDFSAELKLRSVNSVYYFDSSDKFVALTGEEYQAFMTVLNNNFQKQFTELRGTPASLGKARGYARIINTQADFNKMKSGDILVAPMTRTEYLPLMRIAAAIITDEGGVTCHAAIVSRELGKPCIIGTQIATETLKDGDEIEVDADSGIIKKIIN